MKARFDIVRRRNWFFLLSGAITVAGLIFFLVFGFNLGTDFVAGSRVQLQLNQTVDPVKVRAMFTEVGLTVGQDALTVAGDRNDTAVVRFPTVLTLAQRTQLTQVEKKDFPKSQGADITTVDPIVARILSQKAVLAVGLASLFIVIYVAIRFEFRFAIAAIIALLHDAFIVMSVFALLRMEVDTLFVTAVLTIVGYSVNDTIVIFDRIRENMKISKPRTFEELERLVNKSLWQTMTRSINTVLTVLVAALMLYLFGSPSIHTFTLALIIGLISGAYSSIFIASPLWLIWRGRSLPRGPGAEQVAESPA